MAETAQRLQALEVFDVPHVTATLKQVRSHWVVAATVVAAAVGTKPDAPRAVG